MKCRISIIVMQGDSRYHPVSHNYLKVMVDKSTKAFPSAYLSTKPIAHTVQQIYNKHCNLDVRWASPILSDVRHGRFLRGDCGELLETEILYRVMIPEGVIGLKDTAVLLNTYELQKLTTVEEFYERSIVETPRSTQQR
jgi:hypothetical protein